MAPVEGEEEAEGGGTYEHRVLHLLEDAVRDELGMYGGLLDLELSAETLDRLASAVVTRVDYAFDVRWSPDWVRVDPQLWSEADGWRSRCRTCLQDSPPQRTEQAVLAWHAEHASSPHAT